MKFISLRVIEAPDYKTALDSVASGEGMFIGQDPLSDIIVPYEAVVVTAK